MDNGVEADSRAFYRAFCSLLKTALLSDSAPLLKDCSSTACTVFNLYYKRRMFGWGALKEEKASSKAQHFVITRGVLNLGGF